MSTNDGGIRVINEEYERVLSNPENVIVSDALQDLIDLNLPKASEEQSEALQADAFMITALNNDGLPTSTRGELSAFSFKSNVYSVSIETSNVKKELLSCLTPSTDEEKITLLLAGTYDLEITAADVSWSIEKIGPYNYRLDISFRSDNVIF